MANVDLGRILVVEKLAVIMNLLLHPLPLTVWVSAALPTRFPSPMTPDIGTRGSDPFNISNRPCV